jgi:hypothetical protein
MDLEGKRESHEFSWVGGERRMKKYSRNFGEWKVGWKSLRRL